MGIDPDLMRRVASGEYVVDTQAVAAAMLRRGALAHAALPASPRGRAAGAARRAAGPERKKQR